MVASMIVSVVLTIFVLVLTIVTINKGYGYKHKIDSLSTDEQNDGDDDFLSKSQDEKTD